MQVTLSTDPLRVLKPIRLLIGTQWRKTWWSPQKTSLYTPYMKMKSVTTVLYAKNRSNANLNWCGIIVRTRAFDRLCVIYAIKALTTIVHSWNICVCILEKNHTNAVSAKSVLDKGQLSTDTKGYIQEKNHINVKSVASVFLRRKAAMFTKGPTPVNNHFIVPNAISILCAGHLCLDILRKIILLWSPTQVV